MSVIEVQDAFTKAEMADIEAAAEEYGTTPWELIHDAVLNALGGMSLKIAPPVR